ncbi:S41 family peptidase [Alicyclobacillus sp. SO9]|uniref:S41 family peptidase n=1 Tax=Alicyclobacillus sp. SO9 TaxID=2665646 RepID=UPI0018E7620C|nr:S41 family peptidase [Alicyclobacillus sp. SO9]QQE79227.1 hypothetical protein GI364_01560 [Alicyclobacillus sp. SO9]
MNRNRLKPAVIGTLFALLLGGIVFGIGQHSALGGEKVDAQSLTPKGTPTAAEKRAVFSRVWSLFNENYPDFQEKVINWKQEKIAYEPKAMAAQTWPDFFQVVQNMISTLHDSHSGLMGAPLPQRYWPFLFTQVFANQVVVMAAPGNSAVHPGMIVLGMNGKPLTDVLQSSYSDWFRPLGPQVQTLFETPKDVPEKITFQNPQTHVVQTVSMPVFSAQKLSQLWSGFSSQHPKYTYDPAFQLLFFEMKTFSAKVRSLTSSSQVVFRQFGKGILYIHIPLMTDTLEAQLKSHMNEILKAKGLILDLRDNPGGRSEPGVWFTDHLYTHSEVPLLSRTYHHGSFSVWDHAVLLPLKPHISAPTAVLINSSDASSAEMFVAQLGDAPNVKTFGSRTMGADGNPRLYPVMKGVQVRISGWQETVTATGQPIEQVGIAPDETISWSMPQVKKYIDSLEGNADPLTLDPVVQAGKNWILSRQPRTASLNG